MPRPEYDRLMGGSGAQRNPWLYVGDIWVCVGLVQATQS
jgi:hypothetical protein